MAASMAVPLGDGAPIACAAAGVAVSVRGVAGIHDSDDCDTPYQTPMAPSAAPAARARAACWVLRKPNIANILLPRANLNPYRRKIQYASQNQIATMPRVHGRRAVTEQ